MPPDQDQHQPPRRPKEGWTQEEKAQGTPHGTPDAGQGNAAGDAAPTGRPSDDRAATEQAAAAIEQDTAAGGAAGPAPRTP